VGNAPPPDDLTPWIPKGGYDIFSIGAQECKYEPRAGHASAGIDWISHLTKHFGSDYFLLAESHLWQIRLAIFVHTRIKGVIHNVEKSTEATGIGSVMGNKGANVIAFNVNDLSLCFVNAHLAAHQDKVHKRNEDVEEVVKNTKMGFKHKMDILNQYHHVFWSGDLNYRLDWGDQTTKEPTKEVFDQMVKLVNKKDFKKLYATDQLKKEREGERVFVGFEEVTPKFAPTFKVAREAGTTYEEKRSPAWCDRILWRSLQGFSVKNVLFSSAPQIATSDHKPVYATFDFDTFSMLDGWDQTLGPCTVIFQKLEGKNLPAGDIDGKSDPFIAFRAPFIRDNEVRTAIKKSTLNPVWTEKEVPHVLLTTNNKKRLERSFIYVRVFDHDLGSASDLLCSGVLPLDKGLDGSVTPFSIPLTSGGLPKGTLVGEFVVKWLASSSLIASPSSASPPFSTPATLKV